MGWKEPEWKLVIAALTTFTYTSPCSSSAREDNLYIPDIFKLNPPPPNKNPNKPQVEKNHTNL